MTNDHELLGRLRFRCNSGHCVLARRRLVARAIAEARVAGAADALDPIVRAWEELPGGYHSPRTIQRWLLDVMSPAMAEARRQIAEARRDDQ